MIKAYVGCKIIQAEPMSRDNFAEISGREKEAAVDEPGYRVIYPDGYISWSPKRTFEIAYRDITEGEFELLADSHVSKPATIHEDAIKEA